MAVCWVGYSDGVLLEEQAESSLDKVAYSLSGDGSKKAYTKETRRFFAYSLGDDATFDSEIKVIEYTNITVG